MAAITANFVLNTEKYSKPLNVANTNGSQNRPPAPAAITTGGLKQNIVHTYYVYISA